MKSRSLTIAALASVLALGAAAPAFADWDHGPHGGWREREWREHEWRERHMYRPVYVPPPAYYYAPPPVYVAPPVVGFGLFIR